MPQYYFHLYNDVDTADALGKLLPNLAAARDEALNMVRFEISESARNEGRIVLSHRIDIEDREGKVLATVTFGDAVEVIS